MRDPMDELEHFTTPGLTMDPLPAAEVRRRGARLRRRNHALAAVGTVAAVTLIATPLALAATRTTSSEPQPVGPTPSVRWVQQIPGDFPLTAGLPAKNADGSPVRARDGYAPRVTDLCEGDGWDADGAVDVRQAIYRSEEGGSDRTLALYATEEDAQKAIESVIERVTACAAQTDGAARHVELPSSVSENQLPDGVGGVADGSFVYANHYSDAGDLDAVQLVRAGNAILQDVSYSQGVPADDTIAKVMENSPAIEDLCLFFADHC